MSDFKEYRKITEFSGCRLRIMPTFIGGVRTRFTDNPVDVVYANVTVLWPCEEQDVGPIAIYQAHLIRQIQNWWDGRPIEGTLRKRHVGERPTLPEVWVLEDVEVVAR